MSNKQYVNYTSTRMSCIPGKLEETIWFIHSSY